MSDFPAGPRLRNELRMRLINDEIRDAYRRATDHGRTLDCREQRHATAVYGCKDDGAGCICWCHDFPSMNRRKEVAADG